MSMCALSPSLARFQPHSEGWHPLSWSIRTFVDGLQFFVVGIGCWLLPKLISDRLLVNFGWHFVVDYQLPTY
jgi:hypothetical protein